MLGVQYNSPACYVLLFFLRRLPKGDLLPDYIIFIKNYLSKVCTESVFKGLSYCGGPEIKCRNCKHPSIFPCVKYDSQEVNLELHCCRCKGSEVDSVNNWPKVSHVVGLLS